jgi:3-phenylpropionate/trans-cinnamate dioxygenase ferredoxin reductase component
VIDMATKGTVIVGGGEAAVTIAVSLRENGYTDPVTIVTKEQVPPYQRPPLSKGYLAGEMPEEGLYLRDPDFYRDQQITVEVGDPVTAVSTDAGGGTARTASGRELEFTRLALATGASARHLGVPGQDLEGVLTVRDRHDATSLRASLPSVRRAVVIGSGFVALEAAAVLRKHQIEVTLLVRGNGLLGRAVAPPTSDYFIKAHEAMGTTLRFGTNPRAIEGVNGRVSAVVTSEGDTIEADIVIAGVGVEPNVDLAEQLELELDHGIVVDRAAQTGNPVVAAAGDCTVQPHALYPEEMVRIESVQNALDQGRKAAAAIMGHERPSVPVPWFWSDQAHLKLQIVGLSTGYDRVVERRVRDEERYSLLYYRDGRLIAADAVNNPKDFNAAKKALNAEASIDPDAAADPTTALKSLIT